MAKLIPLTKGKSAAVDADWYDVLAEHKWLCCNGYAARKVATGFGARRQKTVYMHRVIANAPDGTEVDHRDGNRLNNTAANLRLAAHWQNVANTPKRGRAPASQYKGVRRYRRSAIWLASISANRKLYQLGAFASEEAAARAYDKAAKELHGEFACLNFPESE